MNFYAEAIQVLADEKTDFRALIYQIAKRNPKAVVSAAKSMEAGFGWQNRCRDLMEQGGSLVEAIKLCRGLTGMGLREAKDACEALR